MYGFRCRVPWSRYAMLAASGSRSFRCCSVHAFRYTYLFSLGTPKRITSKINSLKNVHYKPGGGTVSIVNEKVQLGPIASKCNSFANVKHKPGGGNVVIVDEKLDLTGVHSKISSLKNVKHVPGGGQTQIKTYKLNFTENATSKIGRLSKMTHTPGGGNVQIKNDRLNFSANAAPRIGRLSKITYTPSGGQVQVSLPFSRVFTQKAPYSFQFTAPYGVCGNLPVFAGLRNSLFKTFGCNTLLQFIGGPPRKRSSSIRNDKLNFSENATPRVGRLSQMTHTPGGGNVQIRNEKLNFTENASPKIGHLSKMTHTPGGGNVQIVSHKLEFDKTAKSKIGSLKNAQHRAGGGDVQIFREQLPWLKYNKPNLPPEERARINKQRSLSHSEMSNSINSSST
ncbi:Tau and MAP protein, tubulin-binding repeat protein, partial [Opisthorchis viverrini]